MTTTQLQEAIHTVPFRPFTLVMPDGSKLEVPHRDYIAHKPNGRTAIVLRDDESWSVIDLLLLGETTFGPAPAVAPGSYS